MKRCPDCGKTYPDTERFCAEDGAVLSEVAPNETARATQTMIDRPGLQATQVLACPACGARVEPTESICPYCGTELPSYGRPQSRVEPEFDRVEDATTEDQVEEQRSDHSGRRRVLAAVGYTLAAVAALTAGVIVAIWLAPKPHGPSVSTSPAPSLAALTTPAPGMPAGPVLQLLNKPPLQIEVKGVSGNTEQAVSEAQQTFQANQNTLLQKYKEMLGGGTAQDDGLWVEAEVEADGNVSAVSILTSTSHDPGVDAEVAKQMLKWKFTNSSGAPFKVRYPIVFASDPSHVATVQSALADKVASYNPTSLAEYRMAKVQPTPTLAAVPTVAMPSAIPSPEAAKVPAVAPTAPAAALPPPTVSLRERVNEALSRDPRFAQVHATVSGSEVTLTGKVASESDRFAAVRAVERIPGVSAVRDRLAANPPLLARVKEALASDRRFRRVDAYTNGGVVTLFGKVVTDREKSAAAKLVEQIPGVTGVVNNITTDTDEWRQIQQRINDNLASAGLTKVTVEVIGKYAYLNGEVNSEEEKQRAVTITESTAPVKVEMNMIRVVPKGLF